MERSAQTRPAADRPEWLPVSLFPFASRFAETAGARLHYVDEGAGPTLLMLHGNPTWSFLFRRLIPRLAHSFRCVAMDYPGFGLSRAPADYGFRPADHARTVAAFIEALGLDDVTLVAHDWGGPIGLGVAREMPGRFRAFILGSTWAWPAKREQMLRVFALLAGSRIGQYVNRRLNLFVEIGLPLAMRRRRPTRAEMTAWRGPFPTPESRLPIAVLPREILASHDFLAGVEDGLAHLRDRPALLIWPGSDPVFGRRCLDRLETLFPRHETVHVPRCGHFVFDEAAEDVAAAIMRWHRKE